ncbi:MAG: hypothetical protein HY706_10195 [Candidatus Hydrogenedentes bacterium]|nr:hypothetical protein [Candidatus Hydrogenedentota bacterium]
MNKAVDIFGGEETIRKAWKDVLRQSLGKWEYDELVDMDARLFSRNGERGMIFGIIEGQEKITTGVFERLSCAIGHSPADALDLSLVEKLSKAEKDYWEDQMKRDRAQGAAATGTSGKIPNLSLEVYLMLRALEELESDDAAVSA